MRERASERERERGRERENREAPAGQAVMTILQVDQTWQGVLIIVDTRAVFFL